MPVASLVQEQNQMEEQDMMEDIYNGGMAFMYHQTSLAFRVQDIQMMKLNAAETKIISIVFQRIGEKSTQKQQMKDTYPDSLTIPEDKLIRTIKQQQTNANNHLQKRSS